MLIVAISLVVLSLLTSLGGGYVIVRRLSYIEQSLDVFQDFFAAKSDGSPSPFVDFIGQTGAAVASQVSESVGKTIVGSIGGSMKGASAELERQTLGENPTLAILEGMPKSIKKNPLAFLAMQKLLDANIKTGGGGIGGGNHQVGSQPKFNL